MKLLPGLDGRLNYSKKKTKPIGNLPTFENPRIQESSEEHSNSFNQYKTSTLKDKEVKSSQKQLKTSTKT